MTNAAAAIPLTFDGYDVQHSDFGIFLEITQGLNEAPQVRGRDVTIPARDGRYPRNRRDDSLTLELTGCVRGNGVDPQFDYRTNVLIMRQLFDPERMPAVLSATLENGEVWTINARPLDTMWNEVIQSEFALVSVKLESVDPDWSGEGSGS